MSAAAGRGWWRRGGGGRGRRRRWRRWRRRRLMGGGGGGRRRTEVWGVCRGWLAYLGEKDKMRFFSVSLLDFRERERARSISFDSLGLLFKGGPYSCSISFYTLLYGAHESPSPRRHHHRAGAAAAFAPMPEPLSRSQTPLSLSP